MRARTFLMFQGEAGPAIALYREVFPDLVVDELTMRPAADGAGEQVGMARLRLAGHELMAFDSPAPHAFGFTPATSLFLEVAEPGEVDRLAGLLGADVSGLDAAGRLRVQPAFRLGAGPLRPHLATERGLARQSLLLGCKGRATPLCAIGHRGRKEGDAAPACAIQP